MANFFTAQYYDKPDGEDYVGKMMATNRLALQGALVASTFDVVMFSHPKGYLPTIGRFMWWIGPAMGMASAFTTSAYVAHRLRGKDDTWNYVAGSCAAAGVFGAWQRSPVHGFTMCLFFSIAGAIKKMSLDEGWRFIPENVMKHHIYTGPNTNKFDFTLTPEGEKGWTNGKDK